MRGFQLTLSAWGLPHKQTTNFWLPYSGQKRSIAYHRGYFYSGSDWPDLTMHLLHSQKATLYCSYLVLCTTICKQGFQTTTGTEGLVEICLSQLTASKSWLDIYLQLTSSWPNLFYCDHYCHNGWLDKRKIDESMAFCKVRSKIMVGGHILLCGREIVTLKTL